MSATSQVWHHYRRTLPALVHRVPESALVACLVLLAIGVRWWSIRDNHVFFHFDQARDAFVAREMVQNQDLKIQGPSASGTNETVYHGVVYYYVIAPLYAVFNGNPYLVTMALAVIGATAVIPTYYLTKSLATSPVAAGLAAGLVAVSLEQTQASTWLSNPTLVVTLSVWFYYSLWQVCWQNRLKWWPVVAITLGLNHQAVVVMVFLGLSFALGLGWQMHQTGKLPWQTWGWRRLGGFSALYLVIVASMVLVQARLAWQGIFTLSALKTAATVHELPEAQALKVLGLYLRKGSLAILPAWPAASVLASGWLLLGLARLPLNKRVFLSLWLLAPLGLLAWHARNAYHALLGLEVPLYILLAAWLANLWHKPGFAKIAVVGVSGAIVMSQLLTVQQYWANGLTTFSIEQGLFLNQELAAIDYTYQQASGQPFSVSTLTVPYGYNLTWAYLYDWYGSKQHGYRPDWFGNSQAGTLWESSLSPTAVRLPHHVTIAEQVSGLESWLRAEFLAAQPSASTAAETVQFGAARVTTYSEAR